MNRVKALLFFILFSTIIFSTSYGDYEKKTTDADYARFLKVLKKYKIDPVKSNVKKTDIKWWATCGNSVDGQTQTADIILAETVTIMGEKLYKGTSLQICDWKIRNIDAIDENGFAKDLNIQGYVCSPPVWISKSGKLCRCNLAEKKIINGFEIPKGAVLVFLKGRLYAIGMAEPPKHVKEVSPMGVYEIKNKKLIPLNRDFSTTCDDIVSPE